MNIVEFFTVRFRKTPAGWSFYIGWGVFIIASAAGWLISK